MKNIKSLCLFFIFAYMPLQVFSQAMQGSTWAEVQKNKKGNVIITYVETPNFIYKNANGKMDGICIDILAYFIQYVQKNKGVKLNLQVQGKGDDFKSFLESVKQAKGGVFGLGNVTITEERKQSMSFTPSYINNVAVLITHNSAPELQSIKNIASVFNGMKAYTLKGSTNEKRILAIKNQYYPDLQIAYEATSVNILEKIIKDPKSFTYLDFNYYVSALQNKQPIKRHAAGDLNTEHFGFIMPLNSDWKPLWDEFLNPKTGFTTTAEYKKILVKHLGASAAKMLTNLSDK